MSKNPRRPTPPPPVRTVGGTTIVALYGEIDLVTAPPLAARLDALASAPHPDLVLDLRLVSFIDCAGLAVLCRARNTVRARQGRLRLIAGGRGFLRVLRAAQLGGVFEIQPELPGELTRAPVTGAGVRRTA
ncbi:STAS domain-containing protein [Streptomyces sp. NPDC048290]|uniref:STAS domain-containing protein n=1 Tax=Streptomyces sp. NPDC048290 TaxID=3155811 RepID=UPI003413C25C